MTARPPFQLLGLALLAALAGFAFAPRPVHVFVAGDSTAADKRAERRPETGWAERLQSYFDTDDVRVVNLARNGRSTRTFLEEGRWASLLEEVRPGDVVLIQFGHNDQSESKPDRYTPPDAFQANLRRFVADVRAKEATPVLMTPVVRRRFDDAGRFHDVHGEYPDLTRAIAEETGAPLVDLHRSSEAALRAWGAEGSKDLFLVFGPGEHANYPDGLDDNTHFSPLGASVMARLAAEGIRDAGLGLADHLLLDAPPAWDAVVGDPAGLGPEAEGARRFETIGAALDAIPPERDGPYRVLVGDGRYREKLTVTDPEVHLVGESRDGAVLTYDAHGDTPGPDGERLGTWGSATLTVRAPGFRAETLTIENAFDYPANAALSDDDPAKVANPQAVALMLDEGSDRAVLSEATVTGYQDTFFAESGRAYVWRSLVSGHVDFLFGGGQVVFDESVIVSRDRADKNPTGYVTAPSTRVGYPFGFLFVDSRLEKEPGVEAGSVRLGRPWHPGNDSTANGSAVFVRTWMDDHVGADGYAPISGRGPDGERIWYDLEPTSRFFEWGTTGPGAHVGPRRPQLTGAQAAGYTPGHVLDGWRPARSLY
ncbi:pectinesterase family protein [Rubrivirga marina]|uniref:SGNH hydrolase-type esterase domain-containing protein n=1 Tax=Rubrivirga marina TaxID=1196024 RepID=A0A271IW08_9BACT|nr:pectinesterase family protein [Rubrivirga marina]PAP75403.1 hypothetical protein BSZ37_02550 [Rubrivirga marina]